MQCLNCGKAIINPKMRHMQRVCNECFLEETFQLSPTGGGFFQVEYNCPKCSSITPLLIGITSCLGCGDPLPVIAIGEKKK